MNSVATARQGVIPLYCPRACTACMAPIHSLEVGLLWPQLLRVFWDSRFSFWEISVMV